MVENSFLPLPSFLLRRSVIHSKVCQKLLVSFGCFKTILRPNYWFTTPLWWFANFSETLCELLAVGKAGQYFPKSLPTKNKTLTM